MDQLLILGVLALFGLGMGSFAGATVWRLRARQLLEGRAAGEKVSSKELKQLQPLTEASFSKDRSRCLHCHHQLAWYDLVPLLSWLSTGGRCRYCRAKIGWFEPAIELGVAAFFAGSYLLWPQSLDTPIAVVQFILWLVGGVGLTILFAYDLRWFLLPNVVMFPVMALGAVYALLFMVSQHEIISALISLLFASIILSGLYLALWFASKGKWIGFGDVKLGLALALFLADWQLAFIALFAANLIGCLIVLPGLLTGKLSRGARVPFGPLLIMGGVVAMLFGQHILNWYASVSLF